MRKVLFVATVYKFLNFERSDMEILKDMGFEIHTATNMGEADWLKDDGALDYLGVIKHQIDFARSPFSSQSLDAYRQLKTLMDDNHFDIIHCHTPVAAAIARFAARDSRKKGTKVIYTDHGFHFHKSSGWKSWLLYYPIEYFMAFYTDMIIAINTEDFGVIQRFHVKEKRYIPGVGVNVNYISKLHPDKESLRSRFDIPRNAFVILSVGELSERKNHIVIIKALSKINRDDIYYLICGTGSKRDELERLAVDYGLEKRVIFAGQLPHETIYELGHVVEIGAIPSLIEGLGLAGIETLAAGKPVIGSNVHGIKDYVINNMTGLSCAPRDIDAFKSAIEKMVTDKKFYQKCCANCYKKALDFDIKRVRSLMIENYKDLLS